MKTCLILVLSSLGALGCYETSKSTEADAGVYVAPDCANGNGRLDENTGLCWQNPKASNQYTWQEAIDYCDSLTLGGQDDWRLPIRWDFMEMLGGCDSKVEGLDWPHCNKCAKSVTCTALFGADTYEYWSSSPYERGEAWDVLFKYSLVSTSDDSIDHHVRCVRSVP